MFLAARGPLRRKNITGGLRTESTVFDFTKYLSGILYEVFSNEETIRIFDGYSLVRRGILLVGE